MGRGDPPPEREAREMRWWVIMGDAGMPVLRILARSFDEALAKARLRDPRYCAGYVADDED